MPKTPKSETETQNGTVGDSTHDAKRFAIKHLNLYRLYAKPFVIKHLNLYISKAKAAAVQAAARLSAVRAYRLSCLDLTCPFGV